MSKVVQLTKDKTIIGYAIRSPATNKLYCFWTKEGNKYVYWDFNGDLENPTFSPAMKNPSTGEYFFVTNGQIYYLEEPTHQFANKSVDMIDCGNDFTYEELISLY